MQELEEKSVTRDCNFHQRRNGLYYFTVEEDNRILYQSKGYESYEESKEEGVTMLDALHEKSPLLSFNEAVPTAREARGKWRFIE